MKFLNKYSIDLKKIPKYTKFNGIFREDLDRNLLDMFIKSNEYSTIIKNTLCNSILKKLRNDNTNIHNTQYRQSYGIGRFYGNTITNFPKRIKHTLFKHLNWCDIDMVKGHPSLILQYAKINGIIEDFPTIAEYVRNPEQQFAEMTAHYGSELLEHQKKWLFNSMIYGGGHQGWVDALIDPPDKDLQRGYTATTLKNHQPRHFEIQFKQECNKIKEIIYKNNPELIELLKNEDKNKKYFDEKNICITEIEDDLYEKINPENENDPMPLHKIKNKVISYFLQILENECLYNLYEYLVKENILLPKFCSLEKDGICFKPNKKIDNDLSESLNEYTYKKTGFRIKWKLKPYEDTNIDSKRIEIRNEYFASSTEDTSLNFNDDDEKYESMKKEFEIDHFKVKGCDHFIKMNGRIVEIKKEREMIIGYKHLCYGYATKNTDIGKIMDKSSPLSFIERWLRDENMLLYDKCAHYPPPLPVPDNHFNLWCPFPFQDLQDTYKEDKEGLDLILNFIKILCANETEVYDFFIKWLAHLLQYPAQKSGHFPIFVSKEGVGKGTLLQIIEILIGSEKYFETTNPEDDVWGQFNPLMLNAYFVYINEFGKKNQREADGRIKGLLTDKYISINAKGKDPFITTSFHKCCGSSNIEDPTNVKEDNRRKWIVRCSDELKGNKKKFDEIYNKMEDTNTMRTLFDYLMTIDCKNLRGSEAPKTEYQSIMEDANEHIIQLFLKWSITDIEYHNGDIDKKTDETQIIEYKSTELYDKFKRFKNYKHIHNYDVSCISLLKLIRLFASGNLPKTIIIPKKTSKYTATVINWDEIKVHYNMNNDDCATIGE